MMMEDPSVSLRSSDSLAATLANSIQAIGRGFDVTSDIRLLYCKGAPGSRLVHLDEGNTRDLAVSHGVLVPNVSVDIDCSYGNGKGDINKTPVCSFHEEFAGPGKMWNPSVMPNKKGKRDLKKTWHETMIH